MIELLSSPKIPLLLAKVDHELAREVGEKPCPHCGSKLHRANYRRKPRGCSEVCLRHSYCCSKDGCRKRLTPESVRFLGRKVFPSVVVVLVSAIMHGLSPQRVAQLRTSLGISRATLQRWRQWWLQDLVRTQFWKAARSRFIPPVAETALAADLCERFNAAEAAGLLNLLRFLRPITTVSHPSEQLL